MALASQHSHQPWPCTCPGHGLAPGLGRPGILTPTLRDMAWGRAHQYVSGHINCCNWVQVRVRTALLHWAPTLALPHSTVAVRTHSSSLRPRAAHAHAGIFYNNENMIWPLVQVNNLQATCNCQTVHIMVKRSVFEGQMWWCLLSTWAGLHVTCWAVFVKPSCCFLVCVCVGWSLSTSLLFYLFMALRNK